MPTREYRQIARAADRTRLAVQVRGSGRPLLLLSGQANNHHWWDRVRPDFDAERTTITFDYRGTGDSDAPGGAYTTRLFAQDAVAVMDSLAIEHFDVYGTSMGGRAAQWLAVLAGRRVRSLVLGCTTPGGVHAVERDAGIRRALAGPDAQAVLADLMYTPAWRAAHPGPYQVLGDPFMTDRARRQHLSASNGHDAWGVLDQIDCPTLLLHGSDDRFAPVINAELLQGRIAGSRREVFDGARHAYFDEARAVASPMVLEFLG